MDTQPYSPPPRRSPVTRRARPATSFSPAAVAVFVFAAAAGYGLGRRSTPSAPAAPASAPASATAGAAAPSVPAAAGREFMEVDLDGGRQLPLTPIEQAASLEYVLFKRGIVHLDAKPGEIKAGRAIDVTVDGKPQRVYTVLSDADSRVEEIIVSAKGRDQPHVVDWGTSVSRWDGTKITWAPKK